MMISSKNALVVRNTHKRIAIIPQSNRIRRVDIFAFLTLNESIHIKIPFMKHIIPMITTNNAAINSPISGNRSKSIQKIIWKTENRQRFFLFEYVVVAKSTIIHKIQKIIISILAIMMINFNESSGFKNKNKPKRI